MEEIEELEEEYERLLELLGIEMIEGVGLEGDWDIMTDAQKIEALERGIAECEVRLEDLKLAIESEEEQ